MSSVTEYNIHSLPSVSKRKAKNVEILEEPGRESTVLTGHLPGEWSANRKCALSSALFRRVKVPLALK